ncbi:hypothetical protein ACFXGT_07945 [Streptomyces sp. NPDC059352]|uniref:hypothetical protein n=1 Tax=Streptomyces sp. NPDC059352 TaxID=3346810 RepID=UPI0036C20054
MKRCAYCGYVIEGEAKEIAPESGSGARPAAYWHKYAADCVVAETRETGRSPLQRRLSNL